MNKHNPATMACEYCSQQFRGPNRSQAKSGHIRIGHKGWPLHPTEDDVRRFHAADGNPVAAPAAKQAPKARSARQAPAAKTAATAREAAVAPNTGQGQTTNGHAKEDAPARVCYSRTKEHFDAALAANTTRQTEIRRETERLKGLEMEDRELERENIIIRRSIEELTGTKREVGDAPVSSLQVHGGATHAGGTAAAGGTE